jgi:hypothetical protein
MVASSVVFQSSDLNRSGRAILDAAREGQARVRDKDGLGLVMVTETRFSAFWALADAAATLAALDLALEEAPTGTPAVYSLGSWAWLREFDAEELHDFRKEMRLALFVGFSEESDARVQETLRCWRASAEALADPVQRSLIENGGLNAEDFVEVERPE